MFIFENRPFRLLRKIIKKQIEMIRVYSMKLIDKTLLKTIQTTELYDNTLKQISNVLIWNIKFLFCWNVGILIWNS